MESDDKIEKDELGIEANNSIGADDALSSDDVFSSDDALGTNDAFSSDDALNTSSVETTSENTEDLDDDAAEEFNPESIEAIESNNAAELDTDVELDDDISQDFDGPVSNSTQALNNNIDEDTNVSKEDWDVGYEQQELADALKMVEDFSSLVALKDALQKDLIETKESLTKSLRVNNELNEKSKLFEEHGRLAEELRRDLSFVEEERNNALKSCQDFEFELNNLKEISQRLTRDLDERDDLESTLLNLQERTALLEREKTAQIEGLEEQIAELTRNNDKSEDELTVVMEELETLKATEESLSIELKTSQSMIKQLSYEKEHLLHRVKLLEKEKIGADSKLTQISRKISNRESENFMLQKSITELRRELSDTKTAREKLSKELEVARKSFLELKGKLVNVMGSKEISSFV